MADRAAAKSTPSLVRRFDSISGAIILLSVNR